VGFDEAVDGFAPGGDAVVNDEAASCGVDGDFAIGAGEGAVLGGCSAPESYLFGHFVSSGLRVQRGIKRKGAEAQRRKDLPIDEVCGT